MQFQPNASLEPTGRYLLGIIFDSA